MVTICKIFTFEAAHSLPSHKGKCQHLHGHSYRLEVEVAGPRKETGPQEGMIMDFGELSKIVHKRVVDIADHSELNSWFKIPTAENMVLGFVTHLEKALSKNVLLVRIRLWETATCYAEWRREP